MATGNDRDEVPRRACLTLVLKPPKRRPTRTVGRMSSQKPIKSNVIFTVLKAAWGNYGAVNMSELASGVLSFEFENDADRERVVDMSPWAIHGHCLNLKSCNPNQSIDEVDFTKIQIWTQVHGLSAEMLNLENARQIVFRIGTSLCIEDEKDMQERGYIRSKMEIDVNEPVCPGFWWTNERGREKWAQVKYERMSDVCFGCGRLGHNAQSCNLDIVTSEENYRLPMYGPWKSCPRQRKLTTWHKPGGE